MKLLVQEFLKLEISLKGSQSDRLMSKKARKCFVKMVMAKLRSRLLVGCGVYFFVFVLILSGECIMLLRRAQLFGRERKKMERGKKTNNKKQKLASIIHLLAEEKKKGKEKTRRRGEARGHYMRRPYIEARLGWWLYLTYRTRTAN